MPIILTILRFVAGAAVFSVTSEVLENLFDKDEDTIADEIFSGALAAGVMSKGQQKQIVDAARAIPLPSGITDAKSAANFLEQLTNNKAGLEVLNARLGGFAPLAIKFTKTLASYLTKRNIFLVGGVFLAFKIIGWVVWLPQLVQNYLDQGTFDPEQANQAMANIGLPFRWTISETRKTQTELEAIKLQEKLAGAISGIGVQVPKTRITMTTQTKPKLFVGVLFSSKVSNVALFERVLDDAITSAEDLKVDAQGNLNRWLASLPGRLIYTINIALNPFDENGVKLVGTWATLGIGYRAVSGSFKPLDTIPLGPIDPIVYYPKSSETKQIQIELPKQLSAKEISQIEFPSGELKIVDASGAPVPLQFGKDSTISQPKGTRATPEDVLIAQGIAAREGKTLPPNITDAEILAMGATARAAANMPPGAAAVLGGPAAASGAAPAQTPAVVAPSAAPAPAAPTPTPATPVPSPAGMTSDQVKALLIPTGGASTLGGGLTQNFTFRGGTFSVTVGPGERWEDKAVDLLAAQGSVQIGQLAAAAAAPAASFPRVIHVNVATLHVRASASSQAALAGSQILHSGESFTAVDVVLGENVSGENRWWKSAFGHYVWSGGTTEKP